jgi:hypothetical protein
VHKATWQPTVRLRQGLLVIVAAMTTRDDQLVTTAGVHEVMAAIEAVDLDAPWEQMAPRLRPALPRRRPLPPGVDDLPTQEFGPGIQVTLGLDIGPAMLFVAHEQLAGWGVTAERAFRRAISNIKVRVRLRGQFALLHEPICGVPTLAFQSREGWASALLLLPEELMRVLGRRDGLVLAPMRDLILIMPLDAEPELAWLILEEFAEADMNALDLPLFALVDGRMTRAVGVYEPAPARALRH